MRVLLLAVVAVLLGSPSPSAFALTNEQALAIASGDNDSRIEVRRNVAG